MPYWKDNSITSDRKKEVLDAFLEVLMNHGVADTSVRDLSSAINLQSAGMYYYFSTKEDLVATCAEEAELRLEHDLITAFLKKATDPHDFFAKLKTKASQMSPMMRFYVQVCATPKYKDLIRGTIDRIPERYEQYVLRYAKELGCSTDEIVPYFYHCILLMTNMMIFGDSPYIQQQIDLIEHAIVDLIAKNRN